MKNTKYEDVERHLTERIDSGEFSRGMRMPSIRSLSEELRISPSTVIHAYNNLEQRGILYSAPKSGYFLMKENSAVSTIEELSDIPLLDYVSTSPPEDLIPAVEYRECLRQVLQTSNISLFGYPEVAGLPSLRHSLVRFFRGQQIFANEENICITQGSYQALLVLSGMSFPNKNTRVLVEQPTYSGILNILKLLHVDVIGIQRTSEGLNLKDLEEIFRGGNIKFFYLMPRMQNPTGFSYSKRQRESILKLAVKYNVYLVEDDFLGDFVDNTKDLPLFSTEVSDRVIYVRSFSKSFIPGIRIGAVIIPVSLRSSFLFTKRRFDIGGNAFHQAAMDLYIASDRYEKHIRGIRKIYAAKMSCLEGFSDEFLRAGIKLHVPANGFFAYAEMPEGISAERLAEFMRSSRIMTVTTKEMMLPEFYADNAIRLSVARVDPDQLAKDIPYILAAMKRYIPLSRTSTDNGEFF